MDASSGSRHGARQRRRYGMVLAVAVVAASRLTLISGYEAPQPFGRPAGRALQGGVADVSAGGLVDEFGTLLPPSPGEWIGDADTYAAALRRAMLNFNASSATAVETGNYDPFYPACPIYEAANSMGTSNACRFMRFMKDRT